MCVCAVHIYIYVPYIICISRDAYGIAKILSLCLGNFQTQKQERKGKAGWPFADMERGRESIPSRIQKVLEDDRRNLQFYTFLGFQILYQQTITTPKKIER